MGLEVTVKVDAQRATEEMKAARRDVNARMREGLKAAGEEVALPDAKRLAPVASGRLKSSLVVKSTARYAYLTTSLRGKQGRYVGLHEYGGTVSAPILPRRKQALSFNGIAVSAVNSPRTYKPKEFLQKSVTKNESRISGVVQREILKAFEGFDR